MHPQIYPLLYINNVYLKVGGRLRCIGSPQHLKTRFGNHLELEVFVGYNNKKDIFFVLPFVPDESTFIYVILSFPVSR